MVFSTDTILESKSLSIDSINESFNNDEDYGDIIGNTFERLLDENMEFNALLSSYIGEDFIKEGISINDSLDPEQLFDNIINKFLQFIEDLAAEFRVFLNALLSKNARLTVYKNKLANFRGAIHYNRYFFFYTNLDLDTSYSSYGRELEKEYESLLNGLDKCRASKDLTSLASAVTALYEESQYNEEEFDLLRGKVLKLNKKISEADFKNEIFKFYRNSEEIPIDPNVSRDELNIDGRRVHEAYEEYYNNNRHIRIVERDKQKLKTEANRQKYMIRTTNLKDFTPIGISATGEINNMYKSIISNKCRKVKKICDIYVMLFDGKIDAYKEYNVTNKNILLEAINEIVRQGG